MEKYMQRVLELAYQPGGATAPNPMVGALLVRDGQVLGEGWHKIYGGPHAEENAITSAGDCRKATLYVNLEPCSHWGKRPPCCDQIIKAGITKVVISMIDPNPIVSGKGIEWLRSAGIDVVVGVLENEAKILNEAFLKHVTQRRPFISLKLALSLDGRIACEDGSSQWITGDESRQYAHKLRHHYQAIMVGIGTIIVDNPQLTCRMSGLSHQPLKIVIDPNGRINSQARVFSEGEVLVVTKEGSKVSIPHGRGKVVKVSDRFCLDEIFDRLGKMGVSNILVEGGGGLANSLIERYLIDKYYLFYAPVLLGGKGKGFTDYLPISNINEKIVLSPADFTRLGADWLSVYYPTRINLESGVEFLED